MSDSSEKTTVRLTLELKIPGGLTAERAASLVQRLLAIGLEDARSSAEAACGEDAIEDAELASQFDVASLAELKPARVLVVNSGGMTTEWTEGLVEVDKFDWDDWKEDPVQTYRPGPHFAALAEQAGLPDFEAFDAERASQAA